VKAATGPEQVEQLLDGLPVASVSDRLRLLWKVVLPIWAQGILLRRPFVMDRAEKGAWDARAVHFFQKLRRRYCDGPLIVRTPWRNYALLLSRADAQRALDQTPRPFTPATKEKHAALSHFEPHNSLITRGPERGDRRAFHDAVLESDRPRHRLADAFLTTAREEASRLIEVAAGGELDWPAFSAAWYAGVRRIVFGDAAREAQELTDLLYHLRARSNWIFFRSFDATLRKRYTKLLESYFNQAGPGSLAAVAKAYPASENTAVLDQITQWLFAFDGGGITVFRALALATAKRPDLPNDDYIRALFLDTQRLWPTTPAILRDSVRPTNWHGATLPGNTGLVIFTPFFHRDDERHANAHSLDYAAWLDADPASRPFLSFSSGSGVCPGRQVVTLIATAWLSALLKQKLDLIHPKRLLQPNCLPDSFNYFSIRLRVR
jgi:hypothetical protein